MIDVNGIKYFGIFDDEFAKCKTDDYPPIERDVKDIVIRHIENLKPALTSATVYDAFTGDEIPNGVVDAGMYNDMGYSFPTETLYYIREYDMGIPPEYVSLIVGDDYGKK